MRKGTRPLSDPAQATGVHVASRVGNEWRASPLVAVRPLQRWPRWAVSLARPRLLAATRRLTLAQKALRGSLLTVWRWIFLEIRSGRAEGPDEGSLAP